MNRDRTIAWAGVAGLALCGICNVLAAPGNEPGVMRLLLGAITGFAALYTWITTLISAFRVQKYGWAAATLFVWPTAFVYILGVRPAPLDTP